MEVPVNIVKKGKYRADRAAREGPGQVEIRGQNCYNDVIGKSRSHDREKNTVTKTIGKILAVFMAVLTLAAVPVSADNGTTEWCPEITEDLNGVSLARTDLAGNNRYETARIVARTLTEKQGAKPEEAVLATGQNFPDALSANALAGLKNCPVIISNPSSLSPDTKKLLTEDWKGSVKKIYVVGAVFRQGVFDALRQECGVEVIDALTYAGSNRYNTAEKVCQEIINRGYTDACVIATGIKAADALSVSVWAYRLKMPVLLAGADAGISESTKKLAEQFDKVYILGGDLVVSGETELSIGDQGDNCIRLAGNNRYETSVNISSYFIEATGLKRESNELVFACGADGNYPDALVSGSLAACLDAPVVLIKPAGLTEHGVRILKSYLSKASWRGYFVGAAAQGSIPDSVIDQLF